MGPSTQPSSVSSFSRVPGGRVLPSVSNAFLPMGTGCQSISSPVCCAAARITLTHSGTTSSPMSSPSRIPILSIVMSDGCDGCLGCLICDAVSGTLYPGRFIWDELSETLYLRRQSYSPGQPQIGQHALRRVV